MLSCQAIVDSTGEPPRATGCLRTVDWLSVGATLWPSSAQDRLGEGFSFLGGEVVEYLLAIRRVYPTAPDHLVDGKLEAPPGGGTSGGRRPIGE